MPTYKPCTDPEGNTYPSIQAMCEAHGVKYGTFSERRLRGLPLEECLAPPYKPVTDAKGNEYRSIHALSVAKKVPEETLRRRINKGMPMKDCLKKTKKQKQIAKTRSQPIVDHLGNEYPTVSALCKHYGIGRSTYYFRIQHGWPLEDALTTKAKEIHADPITIDHTGRSFPSQQALCREYHIRSGTFTHRIEAGWSLEDALTMPLHTCPDYITEEHNYEQG